jgi:hypothetical protein
MTRERRSEAESCSSSKALSTASGLDVDVTLETVMPRCPTIPMIVKASTAVLAFW